MDPMKTAAFSDEEERILEPDEIAAELVPDSIHPTDQQRSLAHSRSQMRVRSSWIPPVGGSRTSSTPPVPAPAGVAFAPASTGVGVAAAAAPASGNAPMSHEQLQAELTRLRNQMRARDAYLRELERALEVTRSELTSAGLRDPQDLHRLLGRVRGQAFRIAELEAELLLAKQSPASGQKNRSTTVPLRKPRHSHIGPVSPEQGTVTGRRTNRAW